MSAKPWTRIFHGDVLNRIADLEGDQIGLYMTAVMLMLDRGGPIPDDMQWLGRRSGVSTRRANQIRQVLLDRGKLRLRDGLLGADWVIVEIERRDQISENNRNAALARWHIDREPELEFNGNGDKSGDKRQKTAISANADASRTNGSAGRMQKSGKNGEKSEINQRTNRFNSENTHEETAENRQSGSENASRDSRARAPTRVQKLESNDESSSSEPRETLGPDADLIDLLDAVSEASGYRPVNPNQVSEAIGFIKSWRDDGLDFDRVIIPTILHITANTTDPTSSLRRFDRRVRLENAKAISSGLAARPYRAPQTPIFEFPGENAMFVPLRRDLAAALGPTVYCSLAHDVRMDQPDGRSIVRIEGRTSNDLKSGDCMSKLRHVARKHGFEQVW